MDGHLKLADGLMRAGSYAPAAQVLGHYLGSHPSDPDALYAYGTAMYRTNNLQAAADAFVKLVALRPNDPWAHYSVGITMLAMGDKQTAREAFTTALRVAPDFSAARQKLAQLGQSAAPPPNGGAADPGAAKGQLVVSGRRAISSLLGRFLLAALLGALGFYLVVARPTAGLRGIADFFFFLTPGRRASDLREQLEFMQRSGASQAQLRAVREELAAAEAALDVTVSRMASALQLLGFLLVVSAAVMIFHGVLLALSTRYQIFEGRIDIKEGVLTRRLDSVWLYQVASVHFEQPLWLALVGHARLRLVTDKIGRRGKPVTRTIVGMTATEPPVRERPAAFMENLFHELRDHALGQGLTIKKFWVQ
ncbi:PH domain-containing protein [Catelliglobosispora koreensis]|uniref:PH domain-containing protein n=1 Tax=Catelliglobosispora koreensis TaxID=129052 RepID=UPI00039D8D5A|nr:PH domain-containing protein [Catelliglobosispora koreensis]